MAAASVFKKDGAEIARAYYNENQVFAGAARQGVHLRLQCGRLRCSADAEQRGGSDSRDRGCGLSAAAHDESRPGTGAGKPSPEPAALRTPLVITELLPNPDNVNGTDRETHDAYEYAEVCNVSDRDVDLKDYEIVYNNGTSDAVWTLEDDVVLGPRRECGDLVRAANGSGYGFDR